VQDHQAQGPHHGHLRESEAQAEAGLILTGITAFRKGAGILCAFSAAVQKKNQQKTPFTQCNRR
jgi:hypothetical protein